MKTLQVQLKAQGKCLNGEGHKSEENIQDEEYGSLTFIKEESKTFWRAQLKTRMNMCACVCVCRPSRTFQKPHMV